MNVDFHKLSRKWQRRWKTQKLYESDPNDKPKFFLTTPYPYVNGYLHIGHTYTYMRVDAFARYKRMRGYNVLFPFAFHATGTPIDAAAKRVQNNEEGQISTLKLMGFTDVDIPAFKDPIHWIKIFSKAAEKDLQDYGMGIDWRRTFITTDLNPRYDKFIKWQFNTLRKKGYVQKGSHPVVWDPVEKAPVGDHARSEGEGEAPTEMTLIKFKQGDKILPCATFRPETIFGATNIWVNPELTYVEATVDGEHWIVAEPCIAKLQDQKHKVAEIKKISGKEITGMVKNPVTGHDVPILPAHFVSKDTGSGIVMSVPAHAPFDYAALKELQAKGQGKDIKPISLVAVEGFGECPAVEICTKMGIHDTKNPKLEEATQEVYKKEFHTGKLKQNTGKYAGKSIAEVKPLLIAELTEQHKAVVLYELVNPVISRSLNRCHVKIVDDQWFLTYSDPQWKQMTAKALAQCKLYPEKVRGQFEHTIDWLKDWACTREHGMGTTLPWDKKWKIESLSDSTIYNAFYTIAHHLKKVPLGSINDKLFDYVMLGQGNIDDIKADKTLVEKMKAEFNYWYPVDFRNSGKDLVQNHLSFYIFNHTGVFPEGKWPAGIGVNGYVTINKAKMSKSKGNFKTLRDLVKNFGSDIVRMAILVNGEEMNDTDWDSEVAEMLKGRLQQFYDFALEHYAEGAHGDKKEIDKWMEHQVHSAIKDSTNAMNETLYRTALQRGFFDIQRHLKWYQRRTAGKMNQDVLNQIIDAQLRILTPFTPHYCEEVWNKLEKQGFIVNEQWPQADDSKINRHLEQTEAVMAQSLDDINQVLKLAKIEKPHEITFFVATDWKGQLCKKVKESLASTRDIGQLMKTIIPDFKQYPGAAELIQKLAKDPSKIPPVIHQQEAEYQNLTDALAFLKEEFHCEVKVVKEQDTQEGKAKQAMPGKPALLVK